MGAGKSRIGRELSSRIGWPFYDSDKWIEEREGRSVKEIFDELGELYFRQKEKEAIRQLADIETPAIIALGGGVILDEENRILLNKSGRIIYIRSSPEAIFERVCHSNKRPLLTVEDNNNFDQVLLERIRQLMGEREALYRQADIIIDRDILTLPEIVEAIIRLACSFAQSKE